MKTEDNEFAWCAAVGEITTDIIESTNGAAYSNQAAQVSSSIHNGVEEAD